MVSFSFISFCFVTLFLRNGHALCYFPDGKTVAKGYLPCLDNGNSFCCGVGYACLSNQLCESLSPNNLTSLDKELQTSFVRGACTDPAWKDSNCPSFCITASNGDALSGPQDVLQCQTDARQYACMDSTDPENWCTSDGGGLRLAG